MYIIHAHDCLELCITGDVRLSLGEDDEEFYNGLDYVDETYYYDKDKLTRGRVELCMNDSFYGICRDSWDFVHAAIVCKQLGFSEYGTSAGILNILGSFLIHVCLFPCIRSHPRNYWSFQLYKCSPTLNINYLQLRW